MNGFDFDKTIYRGDCSTNFFFYMIFTRFYLLIFSPYFLVVFLLYGLHLIGKKKFKELMFFFVPWHKNIDKITAKFWKKNIKKIEKWYLDIQKDDDIIISAGLEFIVRPAIEMLGIKTLLATRYDTSTGKISGENCYNKEKVIRFREIYPNETLEAFYSDSLSDLPMMKISKKAFLVTQSKPSEIDINEKKYNK